MSHLVVFVLLSFLLGICVCCIWGDVGVGQCVCVVLWQCVERSRYVDFLQGRGCVSNRGV